MSYKVLKSELTNEQKELISNILTIYPKVRQNYNNNPRQRYTNSNKINHIEFFTFDIENEYIYLPYMFAAKLLQIIPNSNNKFKKTNREFTGKLRAEQIEVEEEALNDLKEVGTTIIGLRPGFGKTVIGASLAVKLKLLTVVLITRDILATQWYNSFTKFTTMRVWMVDNKKPPEKFDVIICMRDRWDKIDKEIREKVGIMIIDEAHMFCTPSAVECILSFNPYYIIAETATLEREDEMHHMIYAICGEKQIVREPNVQFRVIKYNTGIIPVTKYSDDKLRYWTNLRNELENNRSRIRLAYRIIKENPNSKVLILTSRVDSILAIKDYLKEKNVNRDYMYAKKSTYRDSRVLIGTVSKLGTGFDPASSCLDFEGVHFDLLILFCSFRSIPLINQNIGRVFRTNYPSIFYFVDDNSTIKNHWSIFKKWCVDRGGDIEEASS